MEIRKTPSYKRPECGITYTDEALKDKYHKMEFQRRPITIVLTEYNTTVSVKGSHTEYYVLRST